VPDGAKARAGPPRYVTFYCWSAAGQPGRERRVSAARAKPASVNSPLPSRHEACRYRQWYGRRGRNACRILNATRADAAGKQA